MTSTTGKPMFALPPIQPETQPYWDAAERGVLMLKSCEGCGQRHFHPREICPFCGSAETVWIEGSGRGRIYSYTVVRRGLPRAQAVAYVTLEEGPTVMAEIATDDFASLAIGQAVRAGFADLMGRPLLTFRPDA